jgi:hypothetical protein
MPVSSSTSLTAQSAMVSPAACSSIYKYVFLFFGARQAAMQAAAVATARVGHPPSSRLPPGKHHWPLLGSLPRCMSSTCEMQPAAMSGDEGCTVGHRRGSCRWLSGEYSVGAFRLDISSCRRDQLGAMRPCNR